MSLRDSISAKKLAIGTTDLIKLIIHFDIINDDGFNRKIQLFQLTKAICLKTR